MAAARVRLSPSTLFVPALGLLFALLFALQNFLLATVAGSPTTWPRVLANALPRWLLYGFLAPLVDLVVTRYPVEAGRVGRRLALHVAAGTIFGVLHSVITGLYFASFHLYPTGETVTGAIRRLFIAFFALNFVVYCMIAGAYHALRYFREIRRRELQASELRTSLTEARLKALHAQLNPHFLFNTLNAISTLALTGQQGAVVEVLSHLSDLLRVSLDPALPPEIPLEREIKILSAYLEIQRIRFGDRLTVDLEISEDVLGARVPAMVLQPLVENAFEHGIARCPGPGRVTIRARRRANHLEIRVEDTGPGFAPGARVGIGLSNTRARLEQLYGDPQAVEQGNRPAGGAFIALRLPLRVKEGAA